MEKCVEPLYFEVAKEDGTKVRKPFWDIGNFSASAISSIDVSSMPENFVSHLIPLYGAAISGNTKTADATEKDRPFTLTPLKD